jgi:hypothetical protein
MQWSVWNGLQLLHTIKINFIIVTLHHLIKFLTKLKVKNVQLFRTFGYLINLERDALTWMRSYDQVVFVWSSANTIILCCTSSICWQWELLFCIMLQIYILYIKYLASDNIKHWPYMHQILLHVLLYSASHVMSCVMILDHKAVFL